MPQQTVYIRKDDMPKWKALENKAAFISDNLNRLPPTEEAVPLDSLPTPTGPITPPKPEHLEGEDVYWDKFQQRWRERVYE